MTPPRRARTFFLVWIALLALLALSCGSALVELGAYNTVLNFAIAASKALLVGLFFMHLERASPLTRVFAVTAVFMLLVLFALSAADYTTRHTAPAVWSQPPH